jgi:hypothetical protein
MKPVYRSVAVVALSSDMSGMGGLAGLAGQFGGIAALAGLPLGRNDNRVEALGVLRSHLLISKLIENNNLMPILFEKKWDNAAKKWKEGEKMPTLGDAYRLFDNNILQVREDLKSGLIMVRVEWGDRAICADWAQKIVDLANEELRRRAIEESTAALAILERQYQSAVSVSLQNAISGVMEAQLRSRTLAEVREQYAFTIIDPPVVSDPDKRVRPTRTLIVIIGGFLGGLLAILVAAFLDTRKRLAALARGQPQGDLNTE